MKAVAVRVALDNDRLGVVAEHVYGGAAEILQGTFQTRHQRNAAFVAREIDVGVARESQFGGKRTQRDVAPPEDHEVDLQLTTGFGLEAHHRLIRRRRPNLAQVFFELRDAALVALTADFPQEHRRRQPDLAGRLDALLHVGVVCVDFGRARPARAIVAVALAGEDRTDRIASDARLSGDRADPLALPMQDVYRPNAPLYLGSVSSLMRPLRGKVATQGLASEPSRIASSHATVPDSRDYRRLGGVPGSNRRGSGESLGQSGK